MTDICDYFGTCTAPIINGVPLCHHAQTAVVNEWEEPNPAHSGLCCEHRYDEQPPCERCEVAA